MIRIADKSRCCGCEACRNVCPRQCITMRTDSEGFAYPGVDASACVDCGLCETVCPELHPGERRLPVAVYAARNRDESVRSASSSGGVFTRLAEWILDRGGVVFGARFNEKWEVVHDYAGMREDLARFRGSKYVQSRIGDTYRQAERFLKEGRMVLFTGTSCQIAGLKRFLRREYENLLAVDVVCHGVPSPRVWSRYLDDLTEGAPERISFVSFRDKQEGWRDFSLKVACGDQTYRENLRKDPFFRLFLENLTLRPSCHSCPSKGGRSCSDMTLGDFWGIERVDPAFDDDRGCSVVLVYNPAWRPVLEGIDLRQVAYDQVLPGNSPIEESVRPSVNRNYLFRLLDRGRSVADICRLCLDPSFVRRIRRMLFRKLGV